MDDHHFKKEELKSAGKLSKKSMLTNFLKKCLYLARSGRPDIRWSVNKLARSITEWTRACDRLTTQVTTDNIVMRETRLSIVHWVYTKPQILLETLKSLRENLLYLRKSNICSHQLDVQATNVNITQFCRIGNHFVGCWIANGWITCS